jgi:hypothetical protein
MSEVEELVKIQFFSYKTSKSVTHLHDFTYIHFSFLLEENRFGIEREGKQIVFYLALKEKGNKQPLFSFMYLIVCATFLEVCSDVLLILCAILMKTNS